MSNTCPCAGRAPSDYPADQAGLTPCDGVMRTYPSGRRACNCGEHVEAPTNKGLRPAERKSAHG